MPMQTVQNAKSRAFLVRRGAPACGHSMREFSGHLPPRSVDVAPFEAASSRTALDQLPRLRVDDDRHLVREASPFEDPDRLASMAGGGLVGLREGARSQQGSGGCKRPLRPSAAFELAIRHLDVASPRTASRGDLRLVARHLRPRGSGHEKIDRRFCSVSGVTMERTTLARSNSAVRHTRCGALIRGSAHAATEIG